MSTVSDYFGSMVFDDKIMRSMLSADIYRSLRRTINQGNPLNPDVANAVAQAMKNWADALFPKALRIIHIGSSLSTG